MKADSHRPPVRVALMGLGRAMFEDHYPIFKAHPALFKVTPRSSRSSPHAIS